MATVKVRVLAAVTGHHYSPSFGMRAWPEVGEEWELDEEAADSLAEAGWVARIGKPQKTEARPAAKAGEESR